MGEPELITIQTSRLIEQANIVFADVALQHTIRKKNIRFCDAKSNVVEQLVEHARAHQTVVRLVVGNPIQNKISLQEINALVHAGFEYEIIPSLSSESVACTYGGVFHEESSAFYIENEADFQLFLTDQQHKNIAPNTPIACIPWPRRRNAKVEYQTFHSLHSTLFKFSPSVFVIGSNAIKENQNIWFEHLPLFGRVVAITRAHEQLDATSRLLRLRGALPFEASMIQLRSPTDRAPLLTAIHSIANYDVIAFTSANGVHSFFQTLIEEGLDTRVFGSSLLAVIGSETSNALRTYSLHADIIATEYKGENLANAIVDTLQKQKSIQGSRILIPRASIARDALPNALREAGAYVDVVSAYENKLPDVHEFEPLQKALEANAIDAILFTASSTVRNFCIGIPNATHVLKSVVVASIGPITSATCHEHKIHVDVEASPYTTQALVDALERYFIDR